jgi:TIR domain
MSKIVISYRRKDTRIATLWIAQHLAEQFGKSNIFIDIDSIPIGRNFLDHLRIVLDDANILVAVIGENWMEKDDVGNYRIQDEGDFVRLELATALAKKIPVIPLLIDGAPLPKASQLPVDVKDLLFHQALQLNTNEMKSHMGRLTNNLNRLMEEEATAAKRAAEEQAKKAAAEAAIKGEAEAARNAAIDAAREIEAEKVRRAAAERAAKAAADAEATRNAEAEATRTGAIDAARQVEAENAWMAATERATKVSTEKAKEAAADAAREVEAENARMATAERATKAATEKAKKAAADGARSRGRLSAMEARSWYDLRLPPTDAEAEAARNAAADAARKVEAENAKMAAAERATKAVTEKAKKAAAERAATKSAADAARSRGRLPTMEARSWYDLRLPPADPEPQPTGDGLSRPDKPEIDPELRRRTEVALSKFGWIFLCLGFFVALLLAAR